MKFIDKYEKMVEALNYIVNDAQDVQEMYDKAMKTLREIGEERENGN
jgi:hypothetical protein